MDRIFVRLLLLSEAQLIGIGIFCFLVGALLAAWRLDVRVKFRRVLYLWFLVGIGLLGTFSGLVWDAVPMAADAGLLWLLCLAGFGVIAVNGALLYYASAGRANDIGDGRAKAWMGFVPILNFLLLLKKGSSAQEDNVVRSKFSRWVLDPVLVFGALFAFAVSRGIENDIAQREAYDVTESATLSRLMTEAQSLEESFAREAEVSKIGLPVRIDDLTTFTAIEAEGGTLRFRYDLDRRIPGFRVDFESLLARELCAEEMFGVDIARGGTIAIDYHAPSGSLIEGFEITSEDCNR